MADIWDDLNAHLRDFVLQWRTHSS